MLSSAKYGPVMLKVRPGFAFQSSAFDLRIQNIIKIQESRFIYKIEHDDMEL